jgi:hypothetical protein
MSKETRQTRLEESRDATQRDIEIELREFENDLNTSSVNPFTVLGAHPDFEYQWFAEFVYNEPISQRIQEAYDRRFEPVKWSDMPLMNKAMSRHNKTIDTEYVTKGGQILFRRLKAFSEIENKKLCEGLNILKRQVNTATGFHSATPVRITDNYDAA